MAIRRLLYLVSMLAFMLLVGCIALRSVSNKQQKTPDIYQATREAEAFLTIVHGREARNAVEDFELCWYNFETHTNPEIMSQLATGPYLDLYRNVRENTEDPYLVVSTSAFVSSIRIIEYAPERFKTVACVIRAHEETNAEGRLIKPLPPIEVCGVYVFVREDDTWKLAGFFNMADPRDWEYAPDWLQDIIGELPEK